jgi:hypothetical protein
MRKSKKALYILIIILALSFPLIVGWHFSSIFSGFDFLLICMVGSCVSVSVILYCLIELVCNGEK